MLDLFAPLGFGSRVLVVSPPKAGKTTILREIALSTIHNYPQVRLICCLVGERPEEATEITRLLPKETPEGVPGGGGGHHLRRRHHPATPTWPS